MRGLVHRDFPCNAAGSWPNAAGVRLLLRTHAGTGFMHESFDPDDPAKVSRPWFAWCNSLFGELIRQLAGRHPELLAKI